MKFLVIEESIEEIERANTAARELGEKGYEFEIVTLNPNFPKHDPEGSTWAGNRKMRMIMQDIIRLLESGEYHGVVTTLFFNPAVASGMRDRLNENKPPAGLLVAIACASLGIPVSICSGTEDSSAESRLEGPFGWVRFGFLEAWNRNHTYLCGMAGDKHWQRCFCDLITFHKNH